MVVAVVIAAWKYGVTLSVSPAIVPAVLLSSLMAISVGFGMALAIKSPIVVNLITNTLVFVVLLFSPIVFPASHLPPWLMESTASCPSTPWPRSSGRASRTGSWSTSRAPTSCWSSGR